MRNSNKPSLSELLVSGILILGTLGFVGKIAVDYYYSGAGDNQTVPANSSSYDTGSLHNTESEESP